jgi:hypothetical protein
MIGEIKMQPEDMIRLKESSSVNDKLKLEQEQQRLLVAVERLLRIRTRHVSVNNINMLERMIKQLEN